MIAPPRKKILTIDWTTEYLRFARDLEAEHGRKTQVWTVYSRAHGFVLGRVRWYGRWRQYVFEPEPSTLFNRQCLGDVQNFIADRMDEWRNGRS